MINYLLVSLGAAIGGGMRYWVSNLVHKFLPSSFPYGTLTVNILGSFILGLLIFRFDERELLNQHLKIMLTVGFCGGFTTFSTFSYETVSLFRDSQIGLGFLNIFLNITVCIIGVYAAYLISKLG
jgi:fluoride exporter